MAERKVVRSIEAPGGLVCVDIFRDPSGRYGWAQYRRDPEDGRGWYPTGPGADAVFRSETAALAAAAAAVDWLTGI